MFISSSHVLAHLVSFHTYSSTRFASTITHFSFLTPSQFALPTNHSSFIPPFSPPTHSPHDTVLFLSCTHVLSHFFTPSLFSYPSKSNIQNQQHWDPNTVKKYQYMKNPFFSRPVLRAVCACALGTRSQEGKGGAARSLKLIPAATCKTCTYLVHRRGQSLLFKSSCCHFDIICQ